MTGILQSLAAPSFAYSEPGAGFAAMGSILILFAAIALGLLTLLALPFRLLPVLLRKAPKGVFRRVVIVGFDGMDPRRAERLMDDGRMPHLAALHASGTFAKLGSTCPPMSPVAWSTFSTGVNPGKHGIYDFLTRDLRTCLPELSSARIAADAKDRAHAIALRRSRPFWALLGDHGIFSTILRVPIIGYSPNYRASWDTILGKYPREVFLDNRDPWSGDHCIDAAFMSGVLFSNRRFAGSEPALEHLAPAIIQALCI